MVGAVPAHEAAAAHPGRRCERWTPVALGVALLAVVMLGGPRASATHEQPEARGIDQGCPPERVADSGFGDVAGNPHESAIECVAWWGVAQGRRPTAFGPAAPVRRDQMASFVYRMLVVAGVDVPLEAPPVFEDVDGSNAHAKAVNALAELGVVSGFDDGTYRPARRVRRDQMASFVSRSAEHSQGTALTDEHRWFTDVDDDNPHAAAVNGLADAGVVQGRGGHEPAYGPGLGTRRDQMASFLARSLDVLVAEGVATPPRRAVAKSLVDADGADVGSVTFTERVDGQVEVAGAVRGLPEGFHGFHIHRTGSCEPDFAAAGGHHDPGGADHGNHAGDLPVLPIRPDGTGNVRVVTDRIGVDELLGDDGAAVIVHENPDNYANIPDRYGGPDEDTRATGDAGGRLACGVVEEEPLGAPATRPRPAGDRRPGAGDFGFRLEARLQNTAGEQVGQVALIPLRDHPMKVEATLTGLPPGGFHGLHIHGTGSCEPDFAAAGGHHDPEGAEHGNHAGDLPVLLATERGTAWLRLDTNRVDDEGLLDEDGSAVIVHENPDNYANVPDRYGGADEGTRATGDAGGRLACGVLRGVEVDPGPGELSQ